MPRARLGRWALLETGDVVVFAHRVDRDYHTVVAVHDLAAREAAARLELQGGGSW